MSTKRSATGSILLEIKGANNAQLADKLTVTLRSSLENFQDVRIHQPKQMAEITLIGLDASVTREEVRTALALEEGGSLDDIIIGSIRNSPRGIGYAWAKCFLTEANVLDGKKKIQIGWSSVKINLLPPRKLQCFRYLRTGHTKARCDGPIDRSKLCYKWGQEEHKASICMNKSKCVLCIESEKSSGHRRTTVHGL